jgi:hypothetical protein
VQCLLLLHVRSVGRFIFLATIAGAFVMPQLVIQFKGSVITPGFSAFSCSFRRMHSTLLLTSLTREEDGGCAARGANRHNAPPCHLSDRENCVSRIALWPIDVVHLR